MTTNDNNDIMPPVMSYNPDFGPRKIEYAAANQPVPEEIRSSKFPPVLTTPFLAGLLLAVGLLSHIDYTDNHQKAEDKLVGDIPALSLSNIYDLDQQIRDRNPNRYWANGSGPIGLAIALQARDGLIDTYMWNQFGHRKTADEAGRLGGILAASGYLVFKAAQAIMADENQN